MPALLCYVLGFAAALHASGFPCMHTERQRRVLSLPNAFHICAQKGIEVPEKSNATRYELLSISLDYSVSDWNHFYFWKRKTNF